MKRNRTLAAVFACLFLILPALRAQVPQIISYQGRVAVGGVNFNGTGQFKFALVNGDGTTSYWSNDGTSVDGSEPAAAVLLTVEKGLYSVLLGDTSLANMTGIPASVFANSDVRLRVWFSDGVNGSQLLSPDQRIAAVGYAMIAANVPEGAITAAQLAAGSVEAVNLAAGAAAANLGAAGQSPVGGGGVILSQDANSSSLASAGYVKLGETLTVDFWKQRSNTDAPSARREHTAIWTGSEMIIWGGRDAGGTLFDSGARYDPATDAWTPLPALDAPGARSGHTAVWTGSEMIVWGGHNATPTYLNTGARYDPSADTWTPTATLGAPSGRPEHSAAWTGTEMIVWGGVGGIGGNNTGGRYDPVADTWQPTSTVSTPSVGSGGHTAVWTGSEMIVWGGQRGDGSFPTGGGRYDPASDTWTATPTSGAPAGRGGHTAVWTGTEMIVWGGQNQAGGGGPNRLNTGARYTPGGGWVATPTTNAPTVRVLHTAVWTGQEMIVWGGSNDITGGRYNPALASPWAPTSNSSTPADRFLHTAVWTGSEMLIFGGQNNSMPGYATNVPFSYTPPRALYLYQRP